MIKKWFDSIMDHQVNLQERMFRLITHIGMVAFIIVFLTGFFRGGSLYNFFAVLICFSFIATITSISIHFHKINIGASCIAAVVIFLFLPVLFFSGGGMYGGLPLWFVFCFLYVCLVLTGKIRVIFLFFSIVMTVLCYYFAFYNPEYVAQQTLSSAYVDSAGSVIIVGALISIMVIFQNKIYIEENKISERQREEIEALNKAQNRFFSSMSHEIRTPINTIIGLNEMILRRDISEEIAEDAKNIQGAGKMLLTLINDILDLSKIESGKMEIIAVNYETGIFFSDIVNMIWIRAKNKGLEFHLNIDPSIPSMLCGDEVRIKQILINLLNNAIKYTQNGSVTLSVGCKKLATNRVRVSYVISDTGQGIKKENIPFLFDAFQRIDEKKNHYIEGTGLGLSIVKQLVDLMGGEISVNSVYTKGSTFIVTLEQEIIDIKGLGIFKLEKRIDQNVREKYEKSFEAPQARLLIVDDNEMNLMVAAKLLSDTRMQIDTASSGFDCLQLTQNIQYDIILMDHLMPEMDGIECLHALRMQTGGLCRKTPVIALTANAGGDMQMLYKREGFSGYLAKPVSGALLEAAVIKNLPKEKVIFYNNNIKQDEAEERLLSNEKQRIPLIITTDSVSDIPKELCEHLNISILPYYVYTKHGRFLDGEEIESEDLLVYLASEENNAYSKAPEVADYERFFAQKLTEAQNVIHIAMAKYSSEGYYNACAAAEAFENVTVIDSGHLSSGMGIFALYAANLLFEETTKENVIKKLSGLENYISSSFVLDKTKTLYKAGRFPQIAKNVCDALMLHPVIELKKSKMKIAAIHIGRRNTVVRNYVKRVLKNKKNIDKRIIFITYAGIDDARLKDIRELVLKQCDFERVYFQKASPTISCNCGAGTFGLLFMKKIKE